MSSYEGTPRSSSCLMRSFICKVHCKVWFQNSEQRRWKLTTTLPVCHYRHWPHLQVGGCHRCRTRCRHLAATSPEDQHSPHNWWEQSTETAIKKVITITDNVAKINNSSYCSSFPVNVYRSHLFFVFEESGAKVLPACYWYERVLDLVTVEQCLKTKTRK